jgi:hypothetical protein
MPPELKKMVYQLDYRRAKIEQAHHPRQESQSPREIVTPETCQHIDVHEIGCDFDKDGMLLRLIRCQSCGLLMRQYLPML